MNRLPPASTDTPVGPLNFASVAGPPSPEKPDSHWPAIAGKAGPRISRDSRKYAFWVEFKHRVQGQACEKQVSSRVRREGLDLPNPDSQSWRGDRCRPTACIGRNHILLRGRNRSEEQQPEGKVT